MKFQQYCILLFITLMSACANEPIEEKPTSVLSSKKMAEILLDVQLLEASLNINRYPIDTSSSSPTAPTLEIFEKNNITPQQFRESMRYYSNHLDTLNYIYELVLNDLSKLKARVENEQKKPKAIADSTNVGETE